MSCLQKRPKRTRSEEQAFQEKMSKVAQENGKRLGESPERCKRASAYYTDGCAHTCLDNLDLSKHPS